MSAKVYDLAEYKTRKRQQREWMKMASDWDIYYAEFRLMCMSCEFWGAEPGVNQKGCTHKYRQFFEGCPLWRKP